MVNKLKRAAKVHQKDCRAGVVSAVLRAEDRAVRKAAKAHGYLVTLIVKSVWTWLIVVSGHQNFASHFSTTIASL
jgi:hypothetical protein